MNCAPILMQRQRFEEIVARYNSLRIGVVGDLCLDRYLEIDPGLSEVSIETGLDVYNVAHVRSQPGAAGTILNNLLALEVGQITPVGFCGMDGEGFELLQALGRDPRVDRQHVLQTAERKTFTYCKPLLVQAGHPPRELNRLDTKNWTPTPASVEAWICDSLASVASASDALIVMDQVDREETGVVTRRVLEQLDAEARKRPGLFVIGDSRRSLGHWPPVCLKMNHLELERLTGRSSKHIEDIKKAAAELARRRGKAAFVTVAEQGIVGATPDGSSEHVPAHPTRGEIDIVGAGDAVTANLTAAWAAGASFHEALELAMAAASIVIHQLGTTGTARVMDLRRLLFPV
jgi:rfaE bifunctional protein kinase chain/domain